MRRVLFGSLFFAVVGVVAACVGSDPDATVAVNNTDGGNPSGDGATASTNDGSMPADGGSSGTTDTGSNQPPPLDVRTLPGLRLWLESSKELKHNGNEVVSWTDSSGRWDAAAPGAPDGGAHMAAPIENLSGGALFPSFVMNGVAAGRPAIGFTAGTKLAITNHDDFAFGKGEFLIAAVAVAPKAKGTFWALLKSQSSGSGTALRAQHACVQQMPEVCTSPDFDPSTSAHAFVMRRSGDQLVFSIDGTPRSTHTFNPDDPSLTVGLFQAQEGALIGGDLDGEVAELLIIVGPTSDENVGKLETYFKAKYALP